MRLQREGQLAEALGAYERAVQLAEVAGTGPPLAEALRRHATVLHHRGDTAQAKVTCARSLELARALGRPLLAAEALNVLASIAFEGGDIVEARQLYLEALTLGAGSVALEARVEQNLGILSNIQGDLAEARAHYERSFRACEADHDERGQAIALHNLGMVSADLEQWGEADTYFALGRTLAERSGEVHLQALCSLNHSEVHIARQQYERAREAAEGALAVFNRLGISRDKADAYRMLGVVYRDTGSTALAEARLLTAVQLAVESGAVLGEAEAARELARLYQTMGRNQDALALLARSHRLFGRLEARHDLVDVASKRAKLENSYLSIVREWGQSIESADSYTYGHCERVATYGVQVAQTLGLDDLRVTTIRLGAYLHDLGKVRVPHEILNKPGRLTDDEFATIQQHPVWGIELLAKVEFPWDLKPIIRWHHERHDGTGYPDRLKGDEIPVEAQIICIVDVYDALTTTRSYRAALSHGEALGRMEESRHWWRPDVYDAFLQSVGRAPGGHPPAAG